MEKIVVAGSEDFTLGFELVGIESYTIDKLEELMKNDEEIGIIVISKEDHSNLDEKLKQKVATQKKPIVIVLSQEDVQGEGLRDKIVKVLGVDLMKE